jgi:hypothetical protein
MNHPTYEYAQLLDMDPELGVRLETNGTKLDPMGDHVPLSHIVSADQAIDIWLTAKKLSAARGLIFGVLEMPGQTPAIGPIPLYDLMLEGLENPSRKLSRDLNYRPEPGARTAFQILAEKLGRKH